VSDRRVRERLEHVTVPDAAGARRRAWAVAADAYAQQPPPRRSWRAPVGVLAALALAVVVAAVALTPPGAAVAGWVRRALGAEAPAPRSALGPLPAAGRLLVTSGSGTWIVAHDGGRTRLGAFTGATWSPRGLYVAGWHGQRLSAVAPDGRVAWSYLATGTVRNVRWSPDGFRIAYRSGRRLAVVAGDGTGARILDATPGRAAPAWRPAEPHTLAWVARDGRVVVRDVDTGRLVWRSPSGAGAATDLAWSGDGRLLLARAPHLLLVFDVHADRWRRVAAGHGRRIRAAAWAPSGHQLALIVGEGDGTSAVLVTDRVRSGLPGRPLFATTGALGPVAWSPDGRRLLVGWRDADEWLFLAAGGHARPSAVAPLARRFGGAPVVRGWCCGP
jgi:WD40 repeat protein